jgi:hypothetical protein
MGNWTLLHPNESIAKFRLWVEAHTRPGAVRARVVGTAGLDELQAPLKVTRLDCPHKDVDDRRYRGRLARRDCSANKREVTAFIAPAISAALSIGGGANFTVRSQHGGRIRSRQSRIAVGSPTRARSMALRVRASDSPSSSAAAAMDSLLRQPVRRPLGLLDWPFSKRPPARPRL